MELNDNNSYLPYVHIKKTKKTLISYVSSPKSSELVLSFTKEMDMLVKLFL